MLNKKLLTTIFSAFLIMVPLAGVSHAQMSNASSRLLADIPEPPGAKTELPSPIPMVYRFMDALMAGEYDVCLSNFEVKTFLDLLYGKVLTRLEKEEYGELYSYQIQTHRNEFRFLSKIMNRVAAGASIDYSDPRYHGKVQSKVVVRLDTNRGRFDFQVFCRYVRGRWYVYDYILNNQRLTQTFRDSIQGVSVNAYLENLSHYYAPTKGTRPLRNKDYEFSMLVPNNYELHENLSPTLLATLSHLKGQFLLHVQAANYDTPQTLAQVGKSIKETLMPFSPRLYDQWKADVAGVEIGNILFHFTQGNRLLYCHMVLIPLGKKLVVLNFYHSTLQIMKHMSNVRETIIRSITLPRIEAAGGVKPGQFADEINYPTGNEFGDSSFDPSVFSKDDEPPSFDDNSFNEDNTFDDNNSLSQSENTPSEESDESSSSSDNIPMSFDDEESDNLNWDDNIDTSFTEDEDPEMLRPDSFVEEEKTEKTEDEPVYAPSTGSYGDGNFGDDDDYGFDEGSEVAF